jgi:hypothetical protein
MSFFIDRPRYKVRWQNILQQFKNEKRFLGESPDQVVPSNSTIGYPHDDAQEHVGAEIIRP